MDVPASDLDPDCWAKRTQTRYGVDPAGLALQKLRLAAGLTPEQVAAAIGTTRVAIGHWESGRASPAPHYRDTLARLYGVEQLPLPWKVATQAAGASLTAMRVRAGLSQTRAAAAIGVLAQVLCAWERGRTRPPDGVVPVLARLYEVDMAELLAGFAPAKPSLPRIDGQQLRKARLARGGRKLNLRRASGPAIVPWRDGRGTSETHHQPCG